MPTGTTIVLLIALAVGSPSLGFEQDSPSPDPQGEAKIPTARDVFVSAIQRFQGIGAKEFEPTLCTFVDQWLARDPRVNPERTRKHRTAVILGLGTLFDAGDTLRDTPIVGSMLAGIATEEEKLLRDRICSHARLHGRHDAPKHFFLAAALTTRGGPAAATQAGLVKEFADARRFDATPSQGSGFSFLDLAYDHAGVRFAARLLGWKAPERLTEAPLSVRAFLPDFTALALPERIGWQRYQDEYRGEKSEAILDRIHAAIDASVRLTESSEGGSGSPENESGPPEGASDAPPERSGSSGSAPGSAG